MVPVTSVSLVGLMMLASTLGAGAESGATRGHSLSISFIEQRTPESPYELRTGFHMPVPLREEGRSFAGSSSAGS